jgi:N-acetylmuramoyl-L-alanine amidase
MAKIIVIDPGHGGPDSGAVGNDLREKDVTLAIAQRAANFLRERGTDVRLTRNDDKVFSSDKPTDLHARADFANDLKADYFVSIHINAGKGTGFESYVAPSAANQEAGRRQDIVHREVAGAFLGAGLPDRGKKTANFAVLHYTSMPAILLECGFIDRAEDASRLKSLEFLDNVAQAIARGIAQAVGLLQKAPSPIVTSAPAQTPTSAPIPNPDPHSSSISKYYKDIVLGMEWARESVDELYERGIMRGDGQSNFHPNEKMTRLEAAVAINNAVQYILKQIGKG